MKGLLKGAQALCRCVPLVDRVLILFMLLLLGYTAWGMASQTAAQDNAVDMMVRTSAAAIFGYFVSGNFVKADSDSAQKTSTQGAVASIIDGTTEGASLRAQAAIGFFDESESPQGTLAAPSQSALCVPTAFSANRLQTVLVSAVGLLSLFLLFAARSLADSAPATVSQLRDFVSASIGFLISCKKAA